MVLILSIRMVSSLYSALTPPRCGAGLLALLFLLILLFYDGTARREVEAVAGRQYVQLHVVEGQRVAVAYVGEVGVGDVAGVHDRDGALAYHPELCALDDHGRVLVDAY